MANLWPWLAIAGLGALHGLSPANGWMFAAACGVHARGIAQMRRALWSVAAGHAASIAFVAGALAQGLSIDRALARNVAGALLVAAATYRLLRGPGHVTFMRTRIGHGSIALLSFLMATAHGAGLMLVPALVPLCLADNPARASATSGTLVPALAAVVVHTAAMLVTTGVIAAGVCRGIALHPRLSAGAAAHHTWTATLAATGLLLIALG